MHGRERADGRKMLIPMAVAQGGATGPKESPAAALYASVLLFSSAPPRFTPVARRCRAASPGQKRKEGARAWKGCGMWGFCSFCKVFFLVRPKAAALLRLSRGNRHASGGEGGLRRAAPERKPELSRDPRRLAGAGCCLDDPK